jgi:uncharacterized protein YhfF/GNAT superfamily N-acetyltransferase
MTRHVLRPARATDAARLPSIYRDAVTALGACDYDAAQVAAWFALAPDEAEYRRRLADGRAVWVAEAEGRAVAYADLREDGRLDHLYCAPDAAGRGLGVALALTLESVALDRGLSEMHAHVSDTARPLFERLGWTAEGRRDLELGGVAIHNHAMRRRIPSVPPAGAATPASRALFDAFRAATGAAGTHQVAAFGDGPEMQDELALLALEGTKRATAGLLRGFSDGEPMPFEGGHVVLLDGRGATRAVWRTTEVGVGPLASVDEAFAWDEGEGERTRDDWLDGHRRFFRREAEREGFEMHDGILTVFERFRLVWPPEVADPAPAGGGPDG